MKNIFNTLSFNVNGKGMYEITDETKNWVKKNNLLNGHLNLFILHTSASLTLMENASSEILEDINNFFLKLVPEKASLYEHNYEGDDDMPAHIKSSMLGCQVLIPATNGKLNLGIWQGIYLGEHRNCGGRRKLVLTLMGV